MSEEQFIDLVQAEKDRLYRPMPWRDRLDGYAILVSECMLQQTQVSRVIPKFEAWMRAFPTLESLAAAPLSEVLELWSGLGYNRRARYLHEAAKQLALLPEPWTYTQLVSQKGIGENTARAIRVYAYNAPEVFIETNVRTVLIHSFFAAQDSVTDAELLTVLNSLITRLPSTLSPREFYWTLMDMGADLKATIGNPSRRSATHKTQSAFKGSRREVRGKVLKLLLASPLSESELAQKCQDDRLDGVLRDLCSEGLIHKKHEKYLLGSE